jgi:hypothetical protein
VNNCCNIESIRYNDVPANQHLRIIGFAWLDTQAVANHVGTPPPPSNPPIDSASLQSLTVGRIWQLLNHPAAWSWKNEADNTEHEDPTNIESSQIGTRDFVETEAEPAQAGAQASWRQPGARPSKSFAG